MKLLHIIPTFYPSLIYGGPIIATYNMCKELVKRNYEVTVLTTNQNGKNKLNVNTNEEINLDGIKVIYFNNYTYLNKIYYSSQFSKYLNQKINNYEIVHLHSIFTWPIYQAFKEAKKNHLPTILSPRGMLSKDLFYKKNYLLKNLSLSLFYNNIINQTDLIHFTSKLELNEYNQFNYTNKNIKIVPNGINQKNEEIDYCEPELKKVLNINFKNRIVLTFLGRINWKKNIEKVIDILKNFENTILIIAGKGDEKYIKKLKYLINKSSLSNRVFFVGEVYGKYKEKLYQITSYSILLSYQENFANSILESFFYKTPAIISNKLGILEFINLKRCFFEIQNNSMINQNLISNNINLKDYINMPINNIDTFNSIKNDCYKVSMNLQWSKIIEEYIRMYMQLK